MEIFKLIKNEILNELYLILGFLSLLGEVIIYFPVKVIGVYSELFDLFKKYIKNVNLDLSIVGAAVASILKTGLKVVSKAAGIFTNVGEFVKKSPGRLFLWVNSEYKNSVPFSMAVAVNRKYNSQQAKNRRLEIKKRAVLFSKFLGVFIAGIVSAILFIFVPVEVYGWYKELPQPDLVSQVQNEPTRILDRNGRLLYEIFVDKKYEPVPLEEIPDYLIEATIAVEDDEFYAHRGIRPLSMVRAAKATLLENSIQGGSTITQQLVKNVLLSPEQTVSRKIKEAVLALMVENRYSKNEILELYLNNIPYGGTAWGVQSASQKYFGKDVQDITLGEAAFLASLPSAPTRYSPFENEYVEIKSRQELVLRKMVGTGAISQNDAEIAEEQELEFSPQVEYIRAPHFVAYVRNMLVEKYGQRMVDFGGLTVKTTLDLDLQEKAQKIVRDGVEESRRLGISNGASVVLDTKNGEILAYVGSIDYFDEENDGKFDVVTAYRQPGSSVKPMTYALAFENGYTPASTIEDAPLTIVTYGQKYSPKNYDGRYHGKVTLREALANSYNIPAVKLIRSLGPDNLVILGNKLGLKNWHVGNDYGYSITLGGKEVTLLDHTNVFATFGRGGVYTDTTPFVSVKDSNGYELLPPRDEGERVLDAGATYLVTSIISDNKARLSAFGTNNNLEIPGHAVAVKTGTSDEKRDNWTLGYTPSYTVGVWVGNNDNSPMNQNLASGLSGAAPIWNGIMKTVLEGAENEEFEKPGEIFVKIDKECNKSEIFIEGTAPDHLCNEKVDSD